MRSKNSAAFEEGGDNPQWGVELQILSERLTFLFLYSSGVCGGADPGHLDSVCLTEPQKYVFPDWRLAPQLP